MQLADLQADVARAVVWRTIPSCAALLTGGRDPRYRFEVHARHYHASLARSLVERFAATVWLAGSELVTSAAMAFVREHPPTGPCIAEYGDGFPVYLAARSEARRLPYLAQFAGLDWHLGRLAIAVDATPLATFVDCDPERMADGRLTIQPGTEYIRLDWPLDELMGLYLSGQCPDQYMLRLETVWLEVRGCRGELAMSRLAGSDFVFRRAIAGGATLGDAAERAIGIDDSFDPGKATLDMLRAGLLTGIVPAAGEAR